VRLVSALPSPNDALLLFLFSLLFVLISYAGQVDGPVYVWSLNLLDPSASAVLVSSELGACACLPPRVARPARAPLPSSAAARQRRAADARCLCSALSARLGLPLTAGSNALLSLDAAAPEAEPRASLRVLVGVDSPVRRTPTYLLSATLTLGARAGLAAQSSVNLSSPAADGSWAAVFDDAARAATGGLVGLYARCRCTDTRRAGLPPSAYALRLRTSARGSIPPE
jgi:hypothetical protein